MVDINSSNVVDDNTVDAADGTFYRIYLLIIVCFVAVVTRGRKRKRVYVEDSGSNEEFDIENPPWNNDTENTNSNTNKGSSSSKKSYQREKGGTLGGNACNLTDNGPGGVKHLSKLNTTAAMGDYFEGTGFLTGSKVKITEEKVRAMEHDEDEKAVLQLFELEGNMPITCSIDGSPEYKAMSGIIFSLLQSGDIESLDAGSTSSTAPAQQVQSSTDLHSIFMVLVDKYLMHSPPDTVL